MAAGVAEVAAVAGQAAGPVLQEAEAKIGLEAPLVAGVESITYSMYVVYFAAVSWLVCEIWSMPATVHAVMVSKVVSCCSSEYSSFLVAALAV